MNASELRPRVHRYPGIFDAPCIQFNALAAYIGLSPAAPVPTVFAVVSGGFVREKHTVKAYSCLRKNAAEKYSAKKLGAVFGAASQGYDF